MGNNRDYVKTDKAIRKALKKKYPVELWVCTTCGRHNAPIYENCPRCKDDKPKD